MKIRIILILLSGAINLQSQNVLTLNRAVELALQNNLDILIAGNDAKQIHNNNHIGNAGMLPSVSMNVSDNPSLTDINQKFATGTTIERNNVLSNSVSAGLVFSYTLFDGKKMYATKRRLEAADLAGANSLNIQIQQVISNVIYSYCNLIRQNQYLNVLVNLQELSSQRLNIVTARQAAGIANNTDLYLAKLDEETRKQNVLSQRSEIQKAYTGLNVLLNIKADSLYAIEPVMYEGRPLQKNKLDSLLKNNPEWMLANDQYSIALQAQKEIAAARLPLIRFSGAYNYNLLQSQAGFSLYNRSSGPQAGLNLSVPLFTGNVNRVNLENAKLNVQSREWQKQQTIQNLRALYEQSWQDYMTAKQQLASDSIAIATAKNYIELMQQRFQMGQNTIIELKEAQRTYEETYFRFISNQYIAKVAETQLLGLTGQLVGLKSGN